MSSADPQLISRFKAFDEANPQVYEEFCHLAQLVRKAGKKRYGAWALLNVIRWNRDISTRGDLFKINNDFVALYARKYLKEHPKEEGFFSLREMKKKRKPYARIARAA